MGECAAAVAARPGGDGVSGAGWAATSGAALNAIVAPWFDRDRPKAMSMAFNGASVGGILFAPLWTGLISVLGLARRRH